MYKFRKREFFPARPGSVRPNPEVDLVDRILSYFHGLGKGWEYYETLPSDNGGIEVHFRIKVEKKKG